MATLVRRAEIAKERTALTEFLLKFLSPGADERRFDWLYLKNPDGEARTWVTTHSDRKQIVGVAAAFPRRMYSNGEEARGYVLGDFCIHPDHRSLGPALALQRACLEALFGGDADFIFDFPSDRMLAVYKRLQVGSSEFMIRFAKPLRADHKVEERVPIRLIARGLTAVVNTGLRLRSGDLKRSGDWTIAVEAGSCGTEFTQAAHHWSRDAGISVARTAEYLNWRYMQHPQRSYEMLTARQGNKLCGYLVYHRDGQNSAVDDLLAESDAVRRALLVEAIAIARTQRIHTLSAPWLSSHPGIRLLESFGFRPRESSPVVLLRSPQATRGDEGHISHGWYLTDGDRES